MVYSARRGPQDIDDIRQNVCYVIVEKFAEFGMTALVIRRGWSAASPATTILEHFRKITSQAVCGRAGRG